MTSHLYITTHTGRRFYLVEPAIDSVAIEDIAHALAHLCRYTGHCPELYTVAEHSVHVLCRVRALLGGAIASREAMQICRWALLHDAAEAYLGDVSTPLKALLPGYRELEKVVESTIALRFRLDLPKPPIVKVADREVLMSEAKHLLFGGGPIPPTWGYAGVDPIECWQPMCWPPALAKARFLGEFERLFGGADVEVRHG